MVKIFDTFLFFQELDLLEIRLEYLYDKVDKFIIVEACQTFTGKKKPFNFEDNKYRFEKYLDKILYYKIEDSHENYSSIIEHLKSKNSKSSNNIMRILESHTHYPKTDIHWVLDTYHREMLHDTYSKYVEDDDIVLLSDLDEIPSINIFENEKFINNTQPVVCRQHEFMYFLNYFHNSNWLGTIFSKYSLIKSISLCDLRIDSKKNREIVYKDELKNAGYHFTSCGGIETIRKKIDSWGHQEFNTKGIIERLEYNIRTGQDIFERKYGTSMKKIEFTDRNIYDDQITIILPKYKELITTQKIEVVKANSFYNIYRKIKTKFQGLLRRLKILGLK